MALFDRLFGVRRCAWLLPATGGAQRPARWQWLSKGVCGSGLASLLWLGAVQAAPPPTIPQLQTEAGMHRRTAHRLDSDANGRWLVTASDDKTVRVWEAATGHLERVIRPPVVPGNEGRLFSVAMSPDGAVIATGGFTCREWDGNYCVYLFDRVSGRLLKRLKGFPEPAHHLAYSPDGKHLAASLGGRQGLRVWPLGLDPSGATVLSDTSAMADSSALAWAKDGRLAVSSLDGKVRLFKVLDKSLTMLVTMAAPSGARPDGLAFSPDGNELAVGQADVSKVDILDGKTLAPRHAVVAPVAAGGTQGLGAVAWSADGKTLAAAGAYGQSGLHPIRRWAQAGRGPAADVPTAMDHINWLTSLPDGRIAAVSSDPKLGVAHSNMPEGKAWQLLVDAPAADPRPLANTRELFRVSSDGRRIQFSFDHSNPKATHQFDLAKRRLFAEVDNTLQGPRLQGLPVNQWRDSEFPYFADDPLQLEPFEITRSLSVDLNGTGFVLGTSWWLRRFNAQGKQLWEQPVTAPAWSLNQPRVAKLLTVAHGDGVIRWHRIEDGKEILALYPHADRKRWVLWTPAGYYDASVGGHNLLGWWMNRGPDQAADFFAAGYFREKFHRPDIIDRVLQTLDERRAESLADKAPAEQLLQALPPVLEWAQVPAPEVRQRQVNVRVRARVAGDAPVLRWQLRVNGAFQGQSETASGAAEREFSVKLDCELCDIQVLAFNRHGVSPPAKLRLRVQAADRAPAAPSRLLVLAAGISTYDSREIARAASGAKDADEIAAVFSRQKGKPFADVQVRLLKDGQATRSQIEAGLVWLQQTAKPDDKVVVLLSGHGFNNSSLGYSFLPFDTRTDALDTTALAMDSVTSLLSRVQGRTLLLLDTVYAENVLGSLRKSQPHYINRVVNQMSGPETGLVVFSSTTGRQTSQLEPGRGLGLFARALIEGLDGKAAGPSGSVTHESLAKWLEQRLPDISRGLQTPGLAVADGVPDFALATKR